MSKDETALAYIRAHTYRARANTYGARVREHGEAKPADLPVVSHADMPRGISPGNVSRTARGAS